jgi:hypothetical protein
LAWIRRRASPRTASEAKSNSQVGGRLERQRRRRALETGEQSVQPFLRFRQEWGCRRWRDARMSHAGAQTERSAESLEWPRVRSQRPPPEQRWSLPGRRAGEDGAWSQDHARSEVWVVGDQAAQRRRRASGRVSWRFRKRLVAGGRTTLAWAPGNATVDAELRAVLTERARGQRLLDLLGRKVLRRIVDHVGPILRVSGGLPSTSCAGPCRRRGRVRH